MRSITEYLENFNTNNVLFCLKLMRNNYELCETGLCSFIRSMVINNKFTKLEGILMTAVIDTYKEHNDLFGFWWKTNVNVDHDDYFARYIWIDEAIKDVQNLQQ